MANILSSVWSHRASLPVSHQPRHHARWRFGRHSRAIAIDHWLASTGYLSVKQATSSVHVRQQVLLSHADLPARARYLLVRSPGTLALRPHCGLQNYSSPDSYSPDQVKPPLSHENTKKITHFRGPVRLVPRIAQPLPFLFSCDFVSHIDGNVYGRLTTRNCYQMLWVSCSSATGCLSPPMWCAHRTRM